MRNRILNFVTCGAVAGAATLTGCENLPGTEEQQGAVLGGAAGAAAGAAVAEDNRLLGAVIGGVLGAGGGYLIGSNVNNIREEDREGALAAAQEARTDPATAEDVAGAQTADLNDDGFVTLDEVVALEEAGLSDYEIIRRLEATGQVFELTAEQQEYLVDRGVSRAVVSDLPYINQDVRRELAAERSDVIGEPR